jgi:hypothetical protein
MFKIYRVGELENYTVRDILELKDKIDFVPIYQRYSNIWDIYKQKLLIDTILNEFDIPKFYFNYFPDSNNPLNRNNKLYAVIDGKQRLEAILNFIEGRFNIDRGFKYLVNSNVNLEGLFYNQIAESYPEIISKFFSFPLDIVFVATDEEDLLEELFLRLNGGEALTNAEKRNAIGGELNKIIRNIVETNHFFTQKLKFRNPRYQHQDLLTKIAFIEQNNALVTLGNPQLNEFVRSNKTKTNELETLIATIEEKMEEVSNVFYDDDHLLKGKGVIPVYYYFITRNHPDPVLFRDFLFQFENLRIENRRMGEYDANSELIEYDRHNQQAVHTERSLNGRFTILLRYFDMFVRTGSLVNNRLGTANLDEPEE